MAVSGFYYPHAIYDPKKSGNLLCAARSYFSMRVPHPQAGISHVTWLPDLLSPVKASLHIDTPQLLAMTDNRLCVTDAVPVGGVKSVHGKIDSGRTGE